MEEWPRRHRLTVDDYYRMAEVGLLAPDARVELIEGEIVDMAPLGTSHGSVVDRLNRMLTRAAGDRAIVRVQGAVRLDRHSEPQPDLAVLHPRSNFYADHHPIGPETYLVIEVSDSTLGYDLRKKTPLYASHGVPEVWVFDLPHEQLHVFRHPAHGAFTETTVLDRPGVLTLTALAEVSVDLSSVFGTRS
jgi:Uma2 family endonuclease